MNEKELVTKRAIAGLSSIDAELSQTSLGAFMESFPNTANGAPTQILLAASVLNTAERAGLKQKVIDSKIPVAPSESKAYLSARGGMIVEQLMVESGEEDRHAAIYSIIGDGNKLLPVRLLVNAMKSGRTEVVRKSLRPIIGNRGAWLAEFNSDWKWAQAGVFVEQGRDEAKLPDDANSIWQEGSLPERIKLLEFCCKVDLPQAEQWLQEVWAAEKAEVRRDLLEVFVRFVTVNQVEFLEGLLKDRSQGVKQLAVEALAKFQGSSIAQKLEAIGRQLLKFDPKSKTIQLVPPDSYQNEWNDLAIVKKPPKGVGERTYWAFQLLERIRPGFWCELFQLESKTILAAIAGAEDDAKGMLAAISQASLLYLDEKWLIEIGYLFIEMFQNGKQAKRYGDLLHSPIANQVFGNLPQAVLEEKIFEFLQIHDESTLLLTTAILGKLPTPWSRRVSGEVIARVKRDMLAFGKTNSLRAVLISLAKGISPSDFDLLPENWDLESTSSYYVSYCTREVAFFEQLIQLKREVL